MNTDFEAYRRERKYRRQQHRITERPAGRNEVWEQLEAQEATELQDEILNAECDEFFADATKLAASIVQQVAKNRENHISGNLLREMEEFLRDSIQHATNMILNLDWNKPKEGNEAILEPSLKNIVGKELDAFRAEGTAQLSDKHFGHDPFEDELDVVPKAQAEFEESSEPAAVAPTPAPVPAPLPATEAVTPAALAAGLNPHGLVLDPDRDVDVEITSRRIRLSEQELSVDFHSTKVTSAFQADEFDARVPEVPVIQRSAPFADDDEEMPLAATVTSEGVPVDQAIQVEVHEAAEAEAAEPNPEPRDATQAAKPPKSDKHIRQALKLLVKQGVMTPDQARAAYRSQTQGS